MIMFEQGRARFNYRAAAVILSGDQVLLHRAEQDDFWSLPGGRVALLEPAEQALVREMREELETEVEVERLLWVVENFYEYDGKDCHEIALYFLTAFPEGSPIYGKAKPFPGDEEGLRLVFQWHELDALEDLRLYPVFLKRTLKALPPHPQHIVHTNPTT